MFAAMKVAIIIPDRNDRPYFTKNCFALMERQTIQGNIIHVNYESKSESKDITQRYRYGYDYATKKGFDVCLFVENDDYYRPNYIQTMLHNWSLNNQPDLFGTSYTIYYHIKLKKWFKIEHPLRASAMNTLIKCGLQIDWCADSYPYTDMHLWKFNPLLSKIIFTPKEIIALGIKHGVGMEGGQWHTNRLERYTNNDADFDFLRSVVDENSFDFYKNLSL
jgi:hypothetical protein